LMGGRARPQIVRPGATEAWVEGTLDLPAGLLEEPELAELAERLPAAAEEVVVGRRVSASGRTAAFVAGRSGSATDLKLLGARLLSFYGQHEHRKLSLTSAQLEILDGFAGREHLEARRRYRAAHADAIRMRRELAELRERVGARERDLDLYRFELSEIESVAPDADELAELAAERERLRHAEGLRVAATRALAAVLGAEEDGGGAVAAVAEAEAAVGEVGGIDQALDGALERLGALAVELGDLGAELRAYLDRLDADPGRLQAVEERLSAVDRLERKHGGSLESVLAHAQRCREEIARLENAEERDGELERALAQAEQRRAGLAAELSAARRKAAKGLAKHVAAELGQLAMPGAALDVVLEPYSDGFGASGGERVELRVATNLGLEPAPLRDAASGGELSRVMLALTALASAAGAPTVAFDEIDAGIGGKAARAVGERLRVLGEARQVICITHLPQVASLASTHFRIEKSLQG
jgi:DNA repair protein RecN (Recombination protein N)